MKTTVFGVRLTDYQREELKKIADKRGENATDTVKLLIDMLIDGVIILK